MCWMVFFALLCSVIAAPHLSLEGCIRLGVLRMRRADGGGGRGRGEGNEASASCAAYRCTVILT